MKEDKNRAEVTPRPPNTGSRPVSAFFLVVVLMLIYNSNLRAVATNDSFPASHLPFSIIWDHNFYLNRWITQGFLRYYEYHIYFAKEVHGHWLSSYPVIMPVLLVPIYFLPAEWVAHQHAGPLLAALLFPVVEETVGKLCASLIAALSAAVLYLALRRKASPNVSLLIALIYGLASDTFSISSQALWRHGFTELCYAFLLWALWRESSDEKRAFWSGLALGAATANKLADVALLLPFLLYFGRRSRKEFIACLLPMSILGILVLTYNFHFFGRILGAYPNPFALPPPNPASPFPPTAHTPFYVGLAGLLISPSRGLLIYSPWAVLSLWGTARMWKENADGWVRYMIVGLVFVYCLQAGLGQWWGGWCFGPRYMTDLLPFFAIFLLPVWEQIRSSNMLRVAMVLAVAASLWVQVVGVYYYPEGGWDRTPAAVDFAPRRFWDWRDTQISRTWYAGPARPELPYEWAYYFKTRRATSRSRKKPRSPAE